MKLFYININKIYNCYNSGKKICICKYNKISILFLGFFLKKKIINNYFFFFFNKNKFILININKILFLNFFSKQSKKIFLKFKNIKNYLINLGLTMLTTNLGVLEIKECIKLKIGGKLLFSII